jgi:Ca2+-binding RTX toxin-like protein
VERLAEDGDAALLSTEFKLSEFGKIDGVIGTAPIAPGDVVAGAFILERKDPTSKYFNYGSMIIPSNDAWIANGNEREHKLFKNGTFTPLEIVVEGDRILDAGTEVNDELPKNTAFFGQKNPNTGVDEQGVVRPHPGFLPEGGILADEMFANADFTKEGYQVAKITISKDITGTNKNNTINGTKFSEWIEGGGGRDSIDGKGGRDIIFGGAGKDNLTGGAGRDQLYGQGGSDAFFLSPNNGADWILDFQDGLDFIVLKNFAEGIGFADLSITQGTSNGPGLENKDNTLISYKGELLAAVAGTTPDLLSAEDFVTLTLL